MNKPCKHCRTRHPESQLISTRQGKFCSVECISLYASSKDQLAKARKYHQKTQQKDRREKKKQFRDNDRSYQLKECQKVFNAFIRKRDEGKPCHSCGRPGKKVNAGHYRSVGSAPHMRFNQRNCFLQCEHCNSYLSGNLIEYRKRLVELYGVEFVESVEADQRPRKFTLEEIKAIKQYYTLMKKRIDSLTI